MKNLPQLQSGDRVQLDYVEAVAARIADPSDPGGAAAVEVVETAKAGDKPGVAAAAVANFVVEFVSYDPRTSIATFVGPGGAIQNAIVHPKMQEFAAARASGDRVEITIERALAITVKKLEG